MELSRPKIEICCFNVQSVLIAEQAGADRVELCANYLEGGVTPSFATIKLAKERSNIAIHVIVRPRGGDFYYSDVEFDVVKQDVMMCKEMGIDGVVLGFLTPDGHVDIQKCIEISELASPMSINFHRAFDKVIDPFIALTDIINLGFDRILSSGLKPKVTQGIDILKELLDKANDQIIIMPGSGINANNIASIHKKLNAQEYHLTAKRFISSKMQFNNPEVQFSDHPELNDNSIIEADLVEIQKVISALS